ncbi:molecular chaperone DnaJ [Nocardioides lijunqiniae]|uniref:molecular chaperone DnaJ n=1 Tax=Nocardioides lijunqiniae TaxID=2760832 RepID=UPI001878635A|nr:molecular chaperone DnaJ [Nocardioides lijunqiniae]
MRYTVRPLSDRTWLGTMGKEATRFGAKWGSTLELLDREVGALQGRDVVLEIDVAETDLKLNGELRANARLTSSAVVLAFESKHGPMQYRCDRFYTNWAHQGPEWQHNVRAIALTLEALRAVDRYGATETGQQYAGFKALPAGHAMPASHMTRDEALLTLHRHSNAYDTDPIEVHHKRARAAVHPDRLGGDRTLWDQVEQAAGVLGVRS